MRRPPWWHKAYAWMDYAYPWNTLIVQWKFGQQPALARHVARWMRADPHIQSLLDASDLVLPIPLSTARMRERGYNPAAQLARHLAPRQHALSSLVRIRHTPAQSHLSRAQRLRNLRGAFAVPATHTSAIAGRRVVLIDDVFTTGATLTMATRCLLHAGAAQVDVLCMARTP